MLKAILAYIAILSLNTFSTFCGDLVPSRILRKSHKAILSKILPFRDGALVSGERGHLFQLDLNTLKMTQMKLPASQFITSIASNARDKIWAVGHDSLILYSANGGQSFSVQNIDIKKESPIFDISMDDTGQGLVVGAYGYALSTVDGGQKWSTVEIDVEEPHLYSVERDHKGNYYICGEFGSLYKLDSSFKLLKKYSLDIETSFFGLEVLSEDSFFAYGLRGLLVYTKNGNSFEKIPHSSIASFYGSVKNRESILFYGTDGTILDYHYNKFHKIKFDARIENKSAMIVKHKVIQYLDIKERIGITGALVHNNNKLILTTTHGLRDVSY